MAENLKIISPWNRFYKEIKEMFDGDEEVHVIVVEEEQKVNLLVSNTDKAAALSKIIPAERTFGNVTVHVNVIPPNNEEMTPQEIMEKAFKGNECLATVMNANPYPIGKPGRTYVIFKDSVVHYFSDDLQDPRGFTTTLFQEIAKDIFEVDPSVSFCTE